MKITKISVVVLVKKNSICLPDIVCTSITAFLERGNLFVNCFYRGGKGAVGEVRWVAGVWWCEARAAARGL